MVYALIFAGGTGQRMNSKSIPKQFLLVHGKEVIIHTIELFEKNAHVDKIFVVCYEPYIEKLKELLALKNIKKVEGICPGGQSGPESIFLGLKMIREFSNNKDDIVLIHDGVRPLITQAVIDDNIESVKKYGNGITVSPAIETVVRINGDAIEEVFDRNYCSYAKAPQSFYVPEVYEYYRKSFEEGKKFIDSASVAQHYGAKLHLVEGPIQNIKITTQLDLYTFKAILDAREGNQLKEEFFN